MYFLVADNGANPEKEKNHLELWFNAGHIGQINSSVLDSDQLVHHSLICPLREQWCHWVVPAIQNKKNGRRVRLSKVKELSFLLDLELHKKKAAWFSLHYAVK